jgi:glyoxylase-like metal-dependent hydrolase (beta-lactamase superfamily II)
METLLERSARFIDDGVFEGPAANNPNDGSFHEIGDDLGLVCAFSHVWNLRTADGIVVFDTSLAPFGPIAVEAVRRWTADRFERIVYTHGHVDHVGGVGAFLADAEGRGDPRPPIISHENAPTRFDRYELTNGYNAVINQRQFGGQLAFPSEFVHPDEVFETDHAMLVGDTEIVLHHDRGETDDHAWAWVAEHRAIFTGDLFIWVFPNAGNPQKVQRYAADWAVALRRMAELRPELLLPAHGLPVSGEERIAGVLDATASTLEHLVAQTLQMMNDGATLDEIVHAVRVPAQYADLPYLRPVYDEPEFVVRNLWRLYGGWYDGNPARLKPPADALLASEVARLAGGADALAARALAVAGEGDLRLACQLVEWATAADESPGVHAVRAEIYERRRTEELSLMSKGIFGSTAAESRAKAGDDG